MTFSKINEVIDMPNLIEIQKNSYKWFVEEGLKEVFRDMSAITDYSGKLQLSFVDYRLEDTPKYDVTECKARDTTYAAPLRVTARLFNEETGEIKESEVSMGDFPLMTESGTFVINGAERAIVSQLVRSPGVYFAEKIDEKTGKRLFSSTIIPNRGAWLEYETSISDVLYVRIDKNRKLPITTFVRALGLGTNDQIREVFGEDERLAATLDIDDTKSVEEALVEVYKKLRPSEPVTIEGAQSYLEQLFFDPHRYDISRVGRYKYNKKLGLAARIKGAVLSRPIIDPMTGEILADADTTVSKELAETIEKKGVIEAYISVTDFEGNISEVKVLSSGMVDLCDFVDFTEEELKELDDLGINEKVSFPVIKEIIENNETKEDIRTAILERADDLIPKCITIDDIFATVSYFLGLPHNVGCVDDIDHLGNRRIRSVGELLQNQFRIGISRMERVVREKMTLQAQDPDNITPQSLINIRPVVAA
ncbi:MAG: DNA-directed RNA polymerase subunit beta, partial [Clostridia bacterium]|nr:DNA-directed RNA polymerase subunit beta [Clostridia bacterium]